MSEARPDTWMPIYWGDYLKDTADLGALEHGAYLMLIAHYWCKAAPLPMDDGKLARIAKCTPAEWARIKKTIVGFFEEGESVYHHRRVDSELAKAKTRYERRANARTNLGTKSDPKLRGRSPPNSGANSDGNSGVQSSSHSANAEGAQARGLKALGGRRPLSDTERELAAKATGNVPWSCTDDDVERWKRQIERKAAMRGESPKSPPGAGEGISAAAIQNNGLRPISASEEISPGVPAPAGEMPPIPAVPARTA